MFQWSARVCSIEKHPLNHINFKNIGGVQFG